MEYLIQILIHTYIPGTKRANSNTEESDATEIKKLKYHGVYK